MRRVESGCAPTPFCVAELAQAAGPGDSIPNRTFSAAALMNTRCASSRVAVPNPKAAWLMALESIDRPMLDGAAYEPGPGTCGLRLARAALGCRNREAVPNENLGGLPFLDEFCVPNPLFMSYTAPGPSLPKSARQWSTEMKTRASALRSALPNPKTGADALRESCCTPSIERPDAGGRDVGRRTSGMVGPQGGSRRDPQWTRRVGVPNLDETRVTGKRSVSGFASALLVSPRARSRDPTTRRSRVEGGFALGSKCDATNEASPADCPIPGPRIR